MTVNASPNLAELFDTELHVHTYGCLTAKTIQDILQRKLHNATEETVHWYQREFAAAYERPASWVDYPDDLNRLRDDYEVCEATTFARFQASFNLVIALFPAANDPTAVFKQVAAQDAATQLRYAEYRCFVPPHLKEPAMASFLSAYAKATIEASRERFTPRLLLSVSRDNDALKQQYTAIKAWQRANPELTHTIVGLDFCGAEEPHPPAAKQAIFANILRDNQADPTNALALCYHVGETYERRSVMSAARWVWQAASMGVHRVGHATALAVDPQSVLDTRVEEPVSERLAHLDWLLANEAWLKERHYTVDHDSIAEEKASLAAEQGPWICHYTPEICDDLMRLQNAIMGDLHDRFPRLVIESCPSSNMILGAIRDPSHHPLRRMLAAGLNVCLGSDDPGIFGTSLVKEAKLCLDALRLSAAEIHALATVARQSTATQLVKRPEESIYCKGT